MRQVWVYKKLLDKGKRGAGILDFRSKNRHFAGSWERQKHTYQENLCWATQKQWGTNGV